MNDGGGQFSIVVRATFNATHQLRLPNGDVEPVHGHDWKVRVRVSRQGLDASGMVMDFHELERILSKVVKELQHRHLNEVRGLIEVNPTAEHVAAWIYEQVSKRGITSVSAVAVVESPGCMAIYRGGSRT